jgi:Tol biopolymer transport system component
MKWNSIIMGLMNWRTGLSIGIALALGAALLIWQLAPEVEGVLPAESQLRGLQPLQLRFSQRMDPESVESGLILEPGIEGVYSWDEEGRSLTFTPDSVWPPGETVGVQLVRGIRSRFRLPLLGGFSTTWSIRPTSLVYLWPADGVSNLYQINPESGDSLALTDLAGGVLDYSITTAGDRIYFSTPGDNGGSQILSLDPVSGETSLTLDCPEDFCTAPRLSAEGTLLAVEVIPREPGVQPGIQVLDLEDGTRVDLGDPDQYLEKPLWSGTGWLSYYNRTAKGYQFWTPETEEAIFIPNETGGDGSWSPDGRYFLSSEIVFVSDTLAPRHLILIDLVEETSRDLSRGSFLEDLNPSFAPLGTRFAFSRKSLDPQEWTPGRQLWVMDLESETAFPLTDEVDFQHTSFAWHPAGQTLAYVRYNQAALSEPPEIWLIQASGEDPLRLIINGFAPGWVP